MRAFGTFLQGTIPRRLDWLGVVRGMCSLWIVYYHILKEYTPAYPVSGRGNFTSQWERFKEMGLGPLESLALVAHDLFAWMSMGAVGVFILMSGFGLARSAMRDCDERGGVDWKLWASKRFWRLYPFLWFAHLVFLFAPWIAMPEPIDYRFVLSFLGIRVYPMEMILFYANPSWWFFWLILQLYLVFPLLFWVFRKLGPWKFLVLMLVVTLFGRWLILFVWKDWRGMIIGGFFVARLAEFALGMVLAFIWRSDPSQFTARFTGWRAFLAGCIIYPLGLMCYGNVHTYLFVDVLCAAGMLLLIAPVARQVVLLAPRAATFLAFAGSVSLSTFLLHQPWTITAGRAMQGWPWWQFGLAAAAFLPLMVCIAWVCEHSVAFLVRQIRGKWIAPRPAGN